MSIWGTIFEMYGEEACGPPYAYQRSHVLPHETDQRGGTVQLAGIPSHITRAGRDDQPEDDAPWPWLRLSVNQADVVLDRGQVQGMYASMGAWLDQTDPEGTNQGAVR